MDFLFHEMSEKEREEIRKQAKVILDDFSKKLSLVDKKVEESLIEREKFERSEGSDEKCSNDFSREIMFSNAPNKNSNSIIAEKKKW